MSNAVAYLGKKFLGSNFVQDTLPEYMKIDSVCLGENSEFSDIIIYGDIGDVLKSALASTHVVAVVYNWTSKVGYLKTGVGRPDEAVYDINYTTFIVKNRVGVFVNSNQILEHTPYVPVGFNAFFLGLVQETMDYPSHAQITEIFEAAVKLKATTIRSHTLGFSAQATKGLLDSRNNFRSAAWEPIDWAYAEARRCGIKLIIVLTDPYNYYHGSYGTFCEPFGIPKDQFFTHPTCRTKFKTYITEYLGHINQYTRITVKDCTDVAMFELGNELGDIRPDAGSLALPTRDWIVDITKHIKSFTTTPVLNGSDECLGGSTSQDYSITELDYYSRHFYYEAYDQIAYHAKKSELVGKPFILGEVSSRFDELYFKSVESIQNMKGAFMWSMYPHKSDGSRFVHGDGFDFWFDSQSEQNNNILLTLTNHCRRMQKLPEIKTIKELGLYYLPQLEFKLQRSSIVIGGIGTGEEGGGT